MITRKDRRMSWFLVICYILWISNASTNVLATFDPISPSSVLTEELSGFDFSPTQFEVLINTVDADVLLQKPDIRNFFDKNFSADRGYGEFQNGILVEDWEALGAGIGLTEAEAKAVYGKWREVRLESITKLRSGNLTEIENFIAENFVDEGSDGKLKNGTILGRDTAAWETFAKAKGLPTAGAALMGIYFLWRKRKEYEESLKIKDLTGAYIEEIRSYSEKNENVVAIEKRIQDRLKLAENKAYATEVASWEKPIPPVKSQAVKDFEYHSKLLPKISTEKHWAWRKEWDLMNQINKVDRSINIYKPSLAETETEKNRLETLVNGLSNTISEKDSEITGLESEVDKFSKIYAQKIEEIQEYQKLGTYSVSTEVWKILNNDYKPYETMAEKETLRRNIQTCQYAKKPAQDKISLYKGYLGSYAENIAKYKKFEQEASDDASRNMMALALQTYQKLYNATLQKIASYQKEVDKWDVIIREKQDQYDHFDERYAESEKLKTLSSQQGSVAAKIYSQYLKKEQTERSLVSYKKAFEKTGDPFYRKLITSSESILVSIPANIASLEKQEVNLLKKLEKYLPGVTKKQQSARDTSLIIQKSQADARDLQQYTLTPLRTKISVAKQAKSRAQIYYNSEAPLLAGVMKKYNGLMDQENTWKKQKVDLEAQKEVAGKVLKEVQERYNESEAIIKENQKSYSEYHQALHEYPIELAAYNKEKQTLWEKVQLELKTKLAVAKGQVAAVFQYKSDEKLMSFLSTTCSNWSNMSYKNFSRTVRTVIEKAGLLFSQPVIQQFWRAFSKKKIEDNAKNVYNNSIKISVGDYLEKEAAQKTKDLNDGVAALIAQEGIELKMPLSVIPIETQEQYFIRRSQIRDYQEKIETYSKNAYADYLPTKTKNEAKYLINKANYELDKLLADDKKQAVLRLKTPSGWNTDLSAEEVFPLETEKHQQSLVLAERIERLETFYNKELNEINYKYQQAWAREEAQFVPGRPHSMWKTHWSEWQSELEKNVYGPAKQADLVKIEAPGNELRRLKWEQASLTQGLTNYDKFRAKVLIDYEKDRSLMFGAQRGTQLLDQINNYNGSGHEIIAATKDVLVEMGELTEKRNELIEQLRKTTSSASRAVLEFELQEANTQISKNQPYIEAVKSYFDRSPDDQASTTGSLALASLEAKYWQYKLEKNSVYLAEKKRSEEKAFYEKYGYAKSDYDFEAQLKINGEKADRYASLAQSSPIYFSSCSMQVYLDRSRVQENLKRLASGEAHLEQHTVHHDKSLYTNIEFGADQKEQDLLCANASSYNVNANEFLDELNEYRSTLALQRGAVFEKTHKAEIETTAYTEILQNIEAAKTKVALMKTEVVITEPVVGAEPLTFVPVVSKNLNIKTNPVVQRVITQNHETYNSFVNAVYGEIEMEKEKYMTVLSAQTSAPTAPVKTPEIENRFTILASVGSLQSKMDDQSKKLKRQTQRVQATEKSIETKKEQSYEAYLNWQRVRGTNNETYWKNKYDRLESEIQDLQVLLPKQKIAESDYQTELHAMQDEFNDLQTSLGRSVTLYARYEQEEANYKQAQVVYERKQQSLRQEAEVLYAVDESVIKDFWEVATADPEVILSPGPRNDLLEGDTSDADLKIQAIQEDIKQWMKDGKYLEIKYALKRIEEIREWEKIIAESKKGLSQEAIKEIEKIESIIWNHSMKGNNTEIVSKIEEIKELSSAYQGLVSQKLAARFAGDVYEPVNKKICGFSRVTGDALEVYGLSDSDLIDSESGFKAAIYSNGVTTIVSFAGTEDINDWINNAQQGAGYDSRQYEKAKILAEKISSNVHDQKIVFTGHSLGGGLAATAGAVTGATTLTYNAAGVHQKTLQNSQVTTKDFSNITNHITIGDILTRIQEQHELFPEALGERVSHGTLLNYWTYLPIPAIKAASIPVGVELHGTYGKTLLN